MSVCSHEACTGVDLSECDCSSLPTTTLAAFKDRPRIRGPVASYTIDVGLVPTAYRGRGRIDIFLQAASTLLSNATGKHQAPVTSHAEAIFTSETVIFSILKSSDVEAVSSLNRVAGRTCCLRRILPMDPFASSAEPGIGSCGVVHYSPIASV